MGYLDNASVTVDAVLTKKGREILKDGGNLNITSFTVSDTGVDYTLWNPDHPSGSAYYGEAIENLPNLEALPNSAYFMRNNLLTLNREQLQLPYVRVGNLGIGQSYHHTFDALTTSPDIEFSITLETMEESTGWQAVVSDASLVNVLSPHWSPVAISGNAAAYLNDVEIPNATIYEAANGGNTTMNIERTTTSADRSLTITFISKSTGAYKHATFTLPKSINPPPPGG